MNVIYVYADNDHEWNCSEFRCLSPSDAINRAASTNARPNWSAKLIHISGFMNFLDPAIQDIVHQADIIVLQRNVVVKSVIDVMQYWQGLGKPVVIDLDDAYQMLPVCNPAYPFWKENSSNLETEPLTILEQGLAASNGLTAPNNLLLGDWKHVAKGYYIQNYARAEWWTGLPSRHDLKLSRGLQDRIVIGWGGSVSHYDSWWGSGLREAATNISRRYPQVVWMMCGNDIRLYNHLPVPVSSKFLQPGVLPSDWPRVVSTFDIGVAPLFGPYDQRRSWIKGMEYMLAGVPWVATTGEPYSELKHFGTLINNSPDAWEYHISRIIDNLPSEHETAISRVPMAQRLLFMDNNLDVYERQYKAVINDFKLARATLPGVYKVKPEPQSEPQPEPQPEGTDQHHDK